MKFFEKLIYSIFFCIIILSFFSFQSFNEKVLPSNYLIKDFQNYIIQDENLASAAIAMILKYHDKNVEKQQVESDIIEIKNGNNFKITIPYNLKSILDKNGVNTYIKHSNIFHLKETISRGEPTIVLLRTNKDQWNYYIVYGYDEENIFLVDSSSGCSRTFDIQFFMNCWSFSQDISGNHYKNKCLNCYGSGKRFKIYNCRYCCGTGTSDIFILAMNASGIHNYMILAKEEE